MHANPHKDRRIIVTGAASGIGRETALHLARAGARVCLFDLDADGLAQVTEAARLASAAAVLSVEGSVTDADHVDRCVSLACAEWGGVDGLVNSAGLAFAAPSTELALRDWSRVIDVNLTGSFVFARTAARPMLEAGSGSIVNLASIHGRGGAPERAAYCASKAAIVGLTRSLAVEWAHRGVRVNAVAPAYVRTEMVEGMIAGGHVQIDRVLARTPMRRLIEPAEVAAMIAFLLGDVASATTGEIIGVDGGWTASSFY